MATLQTQAERNRWLTRAEAAKIISIQPQTMAKWAMTGFGPRFSRLNARVVRYKHSDVMAFLEQQPDGGEGLQP